MATIYENQVPEYIVGESNVRQTQYINYVQVFQDSSGTYYDLYVTTHRRETRNITLSIRFHCVGETPPVMPARDYILTNFPTWLEGAVATDFNNATDEITSQRPFRGIHRETFKIIYPATVTTEIIEYPYPGRT